MAFSGDLTPVLAKDTKHLSLVDVLSIGVYRIQRSFEPMKKQVEAWKATGIPDESGETGYLPGLRRGRVRCFQASCSPSS